MRPVPTNHTASESALEVWMLVDLLPGYETFDVGDRIEPTTMWIDREAIPGGNPGPLVGGFRIGIPT